jgi:ubiquitin-protein ligase
MAINPRLAKVLSAQYKKFIDDPHPNLLAVMDEEDMRVWYFMISGLDVPYIAGEYIFKLTACDEFPQKPPKFEFYSNTGVFIPGGPICISIGEFHADDNPGKRGSFGWRPSLGMQGFAAEVVNAMICFDESDSGIRIKNYSTEAKSEFARSSHMWNKQNLSKLFNMFDVFIRDHPEHEVVKNILRIRGTTSASTTVSAPAPASTASTTVSAPAPASTASTTVSAPVPASASAVSPAPASASQFYTSEKTKEIDDTIAMLLEGTLLDNMPDNVAGDDAYSDESLDYHGDQESENEVEFLLNQLDE